MIRTLLTTSAVALVLGTAAIAQTTTPETPDNTIEAPTNEMAPAGDATTPPASDATTLPADASVGVEVTREPWNISAGYTIGESDVIVSQVLGAPVYSSTADDAEEIGKINDLILTPEGDINAVVIGVGGFLGIGEKNVAVDFLSLEHSLAADNTWRWVLPTTAEALGAAPDFIWEDPHAPVFEEPAMDPAMAPADPAVPAVPQ